MAGVAGEIVGNTAAQAKHKLDIGDYATIGIIALPFVNRIRAAINRVIAEAYNAGKKLAVDELNRGFPNGVPQATPTGEPATGKITAPALDEKAAALRQLQVNDITDGVVGRLERTARATAINGVQAGADSSDIVSAMRDDMGAAADSATGSLLGTLPGQGVNQGRMEVFDRYITSIKQFQRSEVIDGDTCEICLSLDGRVVKADDPIASMDIVHNNCRGVWVPITVDDDPLDLDPPPKSILDSFDTIGGKPVTNSFTPPSRAHPTTAEAKAQVKANAKK